MRSPIQFLLPGAIAVLALQIQHVLANTEKVIFLGPQQLNVPLEHPTLEDLHLEALSSHHSSLRTHIEAEFPTEESKLGKPSWYLLHRLKSGQRYEVRICWAATEPTSFRLETYELPAVFENPDLITSLAQYSESRQPLFMGTEDRTPDITNVHLKYKHNPDEVVSTLFLQIYAKADYYTMNQTLMENVPPVFVDIILDPYIFNIVPRSLVPTAAYIILLAVGSWYLSRYIMDWICSIGTDEPNNEKKNS
ncbi:GPI mannosyltransferase 2 subunit PGA1 protein [Rutstroemia sp. NJR-2017a BVV2]|nr:GPI mannosyltransferase 2 subunit PGA1 protein [Rutstroemia sp. NJR-2017a BVV2]PQE18560.1 GPI mannosyltransferase 2 subunit PGA1 protein [Rutstroemia sp. NJR-2017a BVV2]